MSSPKNKLNKSDWKFLVVQFTLITGATLFVGWFANVVSGPQGSDVSSVQGLVGESGDCRTYHPIWEIAVFLLTQLVWRYRRDNSADDNK